MKKQETTSALTNIYNLLEPLESQDRRRVIQAALTLLGENESLFHSHPSKTHNNSNNNENSDDENLENFVSLAKKWLKKNNLKLEHLQHVFHFEGSGTNIIATIPGTGKKEKTLNVYILEGIKNYLLSGEPRIDDKIARTLCADDFGCYDQANHANYTKSFGNKITGSKNNGWKLTVHGLDHGAALIKDIAGIAT